MSNPKALDFTMLALALLAALPYNGVIQTAANKLTYCLKNQLFCTKAQTQCLENQRRKPIGLTFGYMRAKTKKIRI